MRERAGGDAGCHTEFPGTRPSQRLEGERAGWSEGTGQKSGPKAGSRYKDRRANAYSWERCAGKPRLRAGGFSLKSNCNEKTEVLRMLKNVIRYSVWLPRFLMLVRSLHGAEGTCVPQRFPTVRRVTRLGNSEHTAKAGHVFDCRFTESSKSACLLPFSRQGLLKLSASRQEKTSGCNRMVRPPTSTAGDPVVFRAGRTQMRLGRSISIPCSSTMGWPLAASE